MTTRDAIKSGHGRGKVGALSDITNIEYSTQAGVDGIQSKSAREDFNLPDQSSNLTLSNSLETMTKRGKRSSTAAMTSNDTDPEKSNKRTRITSSSGNTAYNDATVFVTRNEEKENVPPQPDKSNLHAKVINAGHDMQVPILDNYKAIEPNIMTKSNSSSISSAAGVVSETAVDKPLNTNIQRTIPRPQELRKIPLHIKGTDPARCLDRIDDMYQHFYEQEYVHLVKPFMEQQVDINKKTRSIVVDWLIEVHHTFQLQPLTLWLTVNIMDRYLMCVHSKMRSELQLIGFAAMFISCKYEEIFPPFLKEFYCVCIAESSYARKDILEMERQILVTLNYDIFVPTGYHFLVRYLQSINATENLVHLASYYAERNLQEYDSLSFAPHRMAATALFAALYQREEFVGNVPVDVHDMKKFWGPLEIETGYSADVLLSYARVMVKHVSEEPETTSKRHLTACKKKYSSAKYMSVSNLALPLMAALVEGA